MFGWTPMHPVVADRPYQLTLGPYAFYWLFLAPTPTVKPGAPVPEVALEVIGTWQDVLRVSDEESLEPILRAYLRRQPWFNAMGGAVSSTRIVEQIPIAHDGLLASIALVRAEYTDGEPRTFVLPIAFAEFGAGDTGHGPMPHMTICGLALQGKPGAERKGVLYEPMGEKAFSVAILDALAQQRRISGSGGDLQCWTTPASQRLRGILEGHPEPALVKAEQNNSAVAYGDELILKLFRNVEEGVNLEVEVGTTLAKRTSFSHLAPVVGALDYYRDGAAPMTLAVLSEFVRNEGDAWAYTQDALRRFFEQILTNPGAMHEPVMPDRPFLELVQQELPPLVSEQIGSYLEAAKLLGRRTGEMHLAFASIVDDPAFRPEAITPNYQRSLYQTVRGWVYRIFNLLRDRVREFPEDARADVERVLAREADLVRHLGTIVSRSISGQRIRCHGDYRLGSLLHTGKDFVVIDFEGEPLRPLSFRRHKRSPLRDVASMHHSLATAVDTALLEKHLRPEDKKILEPWAFSWERWVSVAFFKAYLEVAGAGSFLPPRREDMQLVLDFHILARGVFELQYHILNRPDRAHIPLRSLLHLIEQRDRRLAGH
jgi:maltose alpha-D-glucosyltransferase/alpha-amylase